MDIDSICLYGGNVNFNGGKSLIKCALKVGTAKLRKENCVLQTRTIRIDIEHTFPIAIIGSEEANFREEFYKHKVVRFGSETNGNCKNRNFPRKTHNVSIGQQNRLSFRIASCDNQRSCLFS